MSERPHDRDRLMDLVLETMQESLQAISELKGEFRGMGTRFNDRVFWLATEIFHQFKREREERQKLEARIRDLEMKIGSQPSAPLSWPQTIWGVIKTVGLRQVAAMLLAMLLASLGLMSNDELVKLIRGWIGV